ncbi:MAG: hypothetical protein ACRD8Z_07190 [Nitrososphaeraceae archaeon]
MKVSELAGLRKDTTYSPIGFGFNSQLLDMRDISNAWFKQRNEYDSRGVFYW